MARTLDQAGPRLGDGTTGRPGLATGILLRRCGHVSSASGATPSRPHRQDGPASGRGMDFRSAEYRAPGRNGRASCGRPAAAPGVRCRSWRPRRPDAVRPREARRAVARSGVRPGDWAFGMLILVPSLRVARPAWRAGPLENATNLAAHLVFGWAIQLVVEEPARQRNRGRSTDAERMGTRVG